MFQPKASRPISPARNAAGGGRNRLPVSSTMRMVSSGAAFLTQFRPGPERFEEAHRTVEERNRPTVAARIEAADEHRVESVAGEGERGAQAHGSGTDDGNVIGPLAHGAFTIRLWTVRGLTVNARIRHCRPAHRLPMIDP